MVNNPKRVSVTIVIPVRNEEGNIIQTLQSIKRKVRFLYYIIVVDGRSTDKTFTLVNNYIKKHKNVSIIKTSPEMSAFKESLEVGINATKTEFVAVMMGDLCDDPYTLNQMYEDILNGSDIVVGSRYMKGGAKIGDPKIQGAISWAVNKTLYMFTGIPTRDASNPFKMYKKALLKDIKTLSRANEIPIEIIYRAYFSGAKITEVPTTWKGRKTGKSKFKTLQVIPGYAKLYLWVLLNSWKFQLSKII